ncbi:AI-2E family transporter [Actinomarinicola tropica]|uniref:AI-2E family transporter n=1 Tax=Actinomarinicola tropica TaxID=2789776 RepID=A0A5Q2RJZ3_9ACTN|nr:AI-2E family transporter [Actinomarinicola tropica]QGG95242.1 AI-2E family transporter [Actinomarinicola tropica]
MSDPDPSPVRLGGPAVRSEPLRRAGRVAWSLVGIAVLVVLLVLFLGLFRLVVIPLAIALFPAALIAPLSERMKERGWRPGAVAGLLVAALVVGTLALLSGLGYLVATELDDLGASLEQAYDEISTWVDDNVGVEIPPSDELVDQVREWSGFNGEDGRIGRFATTALELLTGALLAVVTLFFFLKDGERIVGFLLDMSPAAYRDDVAEVGRRVWTTIGGYFRGQLVVAAADAVLIGLGLLVLGVPLVVPLSILIFIGGLFPIVGAFTAGAVAVLVALAEGGAGLALAVVAVNVVVQQAEGNLLEPLIVGRATKVHPLAILLALTAGGVTLGVLGAFIAVPLLASGVRVVGYLRERAKVDRAEDVPPDVEPEDVLGEDDD